MLAVLVGRTSTTFPNTCVYEMDIFKKNTQRLVE